MAVIILQIIAAVESCVNQKDAYTVWNYLLSNWNTDERIGDLFKVLFFFYIKYNLI